MNEVVLDFKMSNAVFTCVQVSKITDVSNLFVGTTVGVAVWIEVWAGSLAAFSQVTWQIVIMNGKAYRTDECGIRGGQE